MARGDYLAMGISQRGRAGWIEHQQETSPRHGKVHAAGARAEHAALPSALADERLPGRAAPPRAVGAYGGAQA